MIRRLLWGAAVIAAVIGLGRAAVYLRGIPGRTRPAAADLQTSVFGTIADPKLRGYIIWAPKLDGHETNVPEATHTVADPRAGHYWDGEDYLVHAYDQTLGLGQDAWDIYLLYPPDAHWDGPTPPRPQYWMHQLGGVNGPTLNAKTFADHARALLTPATPAKPSGPR